MKDHQQPKPDAGCEATANVLAYQIRTMLDGRPDAPCCKITALTGELAKTICDASVCEGEAVAIALHATRAFQQVILDITKTAVFKDRVAKFDEAYRRQQQQDRQEAFVFQLGEFGIDPSPIFADGPIDGD